MNNPAPVINITDYTPRYRAAFKSLNEEWISKYFRMEKADYAALDDPEGYILSRGGYIVVALQAGVPVGVCTLLKMNEEGFDYELAKMAVSPKVHGMGIACIKKAKSLGAKSIYLESNTILTPAINLYRKLGFIEISGMQTPYERCDIQMLIKF